MIVFKGHQDLCDLKRKGELGKVFLLFLGIPLNNCPIGNISRCNGDKDKLQLTSVRKLVTFFTGSLISFDAKAKHDTVSFKK